MTSLVFQSLETRTAFSVAPFVAAVPSNASDLTVVGSVAYFVSGDAARGDELWKTDGTCGGTGLVKDIRPGSDSSYPVLYRGETATIGSTLFFAANDGVRGLELWKTDGTESGTVLVKDIAVGTVPIFDMNGNPIEEPAASYPGSLVEYQGLVYFTASDGVGGTRLWKTDGTEGGTQPVTTDGPTPWWNPAIEDQAINRAHRIGAAGAVTVTRFLSVDTIEERIDEVLRKKRDLSDTILSEAGSPAASGLTVDDLFALFKLAPPARAS